MVFSSSVFLFLFLPLVLGLYAVFPQRWRNGLLLIASLFFYAWGEPAFVLVMLTSILANWALALGISRASGRGRKGILAAAVAVNLLLLGFFKYTGFIVENINGLTGLMLPVPAVRLPIGISFFTFQAMSYVIDVYRGQTPAQPNLFKVALFISFFPQLIAGPIITYHDIAQQIDRRSFTLQGVAAGLRRFTVGLSKKILISNMMGYTADQVYALSAGQMNAPLAWLGVISYCFQIYFDFSGYSDMAIGLGKMFGFDIMENFKYPYTSLSVREFWRRWHISLSTWFRDYLYITLGGNRKGLLRTCINQAIVFFATGLWHGAQWTFVVWGLFHGLFLMLETLKIIRPGKRFAVLSWLYTMAVVVLGFALFRATSLPQAGALFAAMFTGFSQTAEQAALLARLLSPAVVAVAGVAAIASTPVLPWLQGRLTGPGARGALSALGYGVSLVLLLLCALSLSGATYNPFIYFRF